VTQATDDHCTPHRTAPNRRPGREVAWTCQHFHGQFCASHLLCQRDNGRRVIGEPAMGCAFWMRDSGADDE